MKNNIAKILKAKKITQRELADRIGMHLTNFNKLVKGKTSPRDKDRYQQIADELGVSLSDLFILEEHEIEPVADDDTVGDDEVRSHYVPFAGTTQAGIFVDVELHSNHQQQYVAIAPDPRYRKAKQFVWQVLGDSMNKAGIHDGMWALGVDYWDFEKFYRRIEPGDIVIVERWRFAGQERERTIKRYWEEDGGIALIPESTNTHHKAIVIPKDGTIEGEEIRIVGYVTGSYTLFGKVLFDLDQ